jgi:hypothetical protein
MITDVLRETKIKTFPFYHMRTSIRSKASREAHRSDLSRSDRSKRNIPGGRLHCRSWLLSAVFWALTGGLGQADPLDPAAFSRLGPSPFIGGRFDVDSSFNNTVPVIKHGSTKIVSGVFYDPTPFDTNNRDEIAVFTFDYLSIPEAVEIHGVRNANARPIALLSHGDIVIDGIIDVISM